MRSTFNASFSIALLWLISWASAQATRPTLEAIDRGVQEIYKQVTDGTVRVVVPLQVGPHPITRWMPRLDPQVREELNKPQASGEPVRVFVEKPLNTTQPLDVSPAAPSGIPINPQSRVILAEFLGLILNTDGDVLLPLFVDKNLVGESPLRVTFGDNQLATARLRGGDQLTNLTVVKLEKPVGKPIAMGQGTPAMGSLVLLFSPIRRQARLMMWTGGYDEHAVIFNSGGAVAGFVRYGHMLEPDAFGPVADQLVKTGNVQRAKLGVLIRDLGLNDPVRNSYPQLGNKPAARVEVIDADSPAEKAGVQKGDVILSLGGRAVHDLPHFAAAMTGRSGPTELRVLRSGKEQVLTVDLNTPPDRVP
jgi:S1-C subfamily serine protease